MQVFKLYFKIVYKYKLSIFLTMGIAFGFAIVFSAEGKADVDLSFTNATVSIIDSDNSTASNGIIESLSNKVSVEDIDENLIEEALYTGELDYVLYIPKGYEQDIIDGKAIKLESKNSIKTNRSYIINNYVENYSNILTNYYAYDNDIENAVEKTNADMKLEVKYESVAVKEPSKVTDYFSFLFYTFLTVIMSAIAIVMIQLNKLDIKRRNTASPMTTTNMNAQIFAATIVFSAFVIVITTAFAYFYYGDDMNMIGSKLYILNLIVLTIPVIAISFLALNQIKTPQALSGIGNVLGLGFSFLGGVFVPVEVFGPKVAAVAKYTPSYWFVETNEMIADLNDLSNLQPIYNNMLKLILLGVVLFIITLIISKKKSKNLAY